MDINEKSLELLLRQREIIIRDIDSFQKTFHTVVISAIALLGTAMSLLAAKTIELTPIVLFVLVQVFFLVLLFVLGLLFACNNKREYIWAIDDFIQEKYGITVLFYHGMVSISHTRGISGFSWLVKSAVTILVLMLIALIIFNSNILINMLKESVLYIIIMILEIIIVLLVAIANRYLGDKKDPKVYRDAKKFLGRDSK